MRSYQIEEKDGPVRSVYISGTMILEVDLNKGWKITNVDFKDDISANEIDYLVVRFEKRKKGE